MEIKITSHAYTRGRERFNWCNKEIQYYAEAALSRGSWLMDLPKWRARCTKYGFSSFAYKYRKAIFIFEDNFLITVIAQKEFQSENKYK